MSHKLVWILLVACGLLIFGAFHIDAPVRAAVLASQGKAWKKSPDHRFHSSVRVFGDWLPLMAASLAALILARLLKSRRWMRVIAAAIIASTLAGIVANASRLTTGRTRPSAAMAQGFYGPWHDGHLLIGQHAWNSFPSGHTATAFGLAAVIFFASPAVGVLAIAGAGLVAWSSIVMGAHHPSDITVSVILSFAVAWFVWRWMSGPQGQWIERVLGLPDPEKETGTGRGGSTP